MTNLSRATFATILTAAMTLAPGASPGGTPNRAVSGASPSTIAFLSGVDVGVDSLQTVQVIQADGSGQEPVTTDPLTIRQLEWSPDRGELLFVGGVAARPPWNVYVSDLAGNILEVIKGKHDFIGGASWSPSGTRIAASVGGITRYSLRIADANGKHLEEVDTGPGDAILPAWSPAGGELAFIKGRASTKTSPQHLCLLSLEHESVKCLNLRVAVTSAPAWSPDGTSIAFVGKNMAGRSAIFSVSPSGKDLRRLATAGRASAARSAPEWAPDGQEIAFVAATNHRSGVRILDIATMTIVRIRDASQPTWSPDGTAIAFTRGCIPPGGSRAYEEVFVAQADGSGISEVTTASSDNSEPAWSP